MGARCVRRGEVADDPPPVIIIIIDYEDRTTSFWQDNTCALAGFLSLVNREFSKDNLKEKEKTRAVFAERARHFQLQAIRLILGSTEKISKRPPVSMK